jgi:hypothetical protein
MTAGAVAASKDRLCFVGRGKNEFMKRGLMRWVRSARSLVGCQNLMQAPHPLDVDCPTKFAGQSYQPPHAVRQSDGVTRTV